MLHLLQIFLLIVLLAEIRRFFCDKPAYNKEMSAKEDDDEILAECSDDEKYNPAKYKKGTWEPKPQDILRIFEEIKTKKVLELHWKCPGHRSPDSDKKKTEEVKEEPKEEEKEEEKKPEVTQFDFDDDGPEPKTVMTPRRTPGSAPKSEKKVARMDKVLKDMMYQRKLQAAEKEARKLALARSPRAPGSPGRARMGSPAGSPRTPPVYGSRTQSPVRAPGPNGSFPTTPVRAPGPNDSVATTPLRAPGPSDSIATTPLRAPAPSEGIVTTPLRVPGPNGSVVTTPLRAPVTESEIASAAANATTVAKETNQTDQISNITSEGTATFPVRTSSGTKTPPVRNILSGEVSIENATSVSPHGNSVVSLVMTSSVASVTSSVPPPVVTSSMTSALTSESRVPTVPQDRPLVSEAVTQITPSTTAVAVSETSKEKAFDSEESAMDTS